LAKLFLHFLVAIVNRFDQLLSRRWQFRLNPAMAIQPKPFILMSYISYNFSGLSTADLIKQRYKHLANTPSYSFEDQEANSEEMQRISFEIRIIRNETFTA
jgi:hypothetical protein